MFSVVYNIPKNITNILCNLKMQFYQLHTVLTKVYKYTKN